MQYPAVSFRFSPWLKAAVTLFLLVVIFLNIDASVIYRRLNSIKINYIMLGIVPLMANVVLVAIRWWLVLRRLGFEAMTPRDAIASTFASVFVGQVLPGNLGADAMRGWLSYKKGAGLNIALGSLVADRLLGGFGMLLVVGTGCLLWKIKSIDRGITIQVIMFGSILVTASGLALFVLPAIITILARWWGWLRKLGDGLLLLRFALLSVPGAIGIGLSCAIQVLTVWAVLANAHGFEIELDAIAAYLMVPIANLASMVPITIAGWGLREASLAVGLALFGVPSEDGTLLALTLGVGLVVASLPGAFALHALDLRYSRRDRSLNAAVKQ
jgi:glycosyltransferase 2 family protein